jgi:hypothetical protein
MKVSREAMKTAWRALKDVHEQNKLQAAHAATSTTGASPASNGTDGYAADGQTAHAQQQLATLTTALKAFLEPGQQEKLDRVCGAVQSLQAALADFHVPTSAQTHAPSSGPAPVQSGMRAGHAQARWPALVREASTRELHVELQHALATSKAPEDEAHCSLIAQELESREGITAELTEWAKTADEEELFEVLLDPPPETPRKRELLADAAIAELLHRNIDPTVLPTMTLPSAQHALQRVPPRATPDLRAGVPEAAWDAKILGAPQRQLDDEVVHANHRADARPSERVYLLKLKTEAQRRRSTEATWRAWASSASLPELKERHAGMADGAHPLVQLAKQALSDELAKRAAAA